MSRGRAKLAVVHNGPEPSPASAPELGLYAEVRAAANDAERWRRMHERGDRAEAITLSARARRICSLGGGTRREKGGHKFEERF